MKHFSKIIILAAIGLLTLSGQANCQAVAQLEADTIALGDQTVIGIRNALNYPSTDALSQDGIIALSQTFDTASRTQRTVITSFEPGEHYIHLSPDDSLLLVVTDVEVDTAAMEPRDIMPLERIPYTFWEIFRWILLTLVVAAIALAIWWLSTHRKVVQQMLGMSEPVDTRTPEERALQRLEELRRKQLWQNGKVKEYHTELTDAVRIFIEEATGIRATEMTSDETIEAMAERYKDTTIKSSLAYIFSTADLVKFAKSEPLANEHERTMNEAVDIVKKTWQYVKPVEKEAADA